MTFLIRQTATPCTGPKQKPVISAGSSLKSSLTKDGMSAGIGNSTIMRTVAIAAIIPVTAILRSVTRDFRDSVFCIFLPFLVFLCQTTSEDKSPGGKPSGLKLLRHAGEKPPYLLSSGLDPPTGGKHRRYGIFTRSATSKGRSQTYSQMRNHCR